MLKPMMAGWVEATHCRAATQLTQPSKWRAIHEVFQSKFNIQLSRVSKESGLNYRCHLCCRELSWSLEWGNKKDARPRTDQPLSGGTSGAGCRSVVECLLRCISPWFDSQDPKIKMTKTKQKAVMGARIE